MAKKTTPGSEKSGTETSPDEDKAADSVAVAPEGEGPAPAQPPIIINAQYIKDLSFEAPTTPGIFGMMQQQQPDITININVNAQPLQDNLFEVVLQVHSDCKVGETVAFIMELSYGGLFNINVEREHLQPVLLIEGPRLLFPFVRYIIADTTRDGGFPPLMMGQVDFVAMFQDELNKQGAQNQAPEDGADVS